MSTDLHDGLVFIHSRLERALALGRVELGGRARRTATAAARGPRPEATDKSKRYLTAAERKGMVALWHEGKSVGQIRKHYDREWAHVRYVLREAGIDITTRKRVTVRERVAALLLRGLSDREIAEQGITVVTYIRSIRAELIAEGKLERRRKAA
jgi:hypothetical protein